MVEMFLETLVILGGIAFLIKACKTVSRQGDLDEIRSLIGEAFLLPYAPRSIRRRGYTKK
jgi:hypothetical protein